MDGSNIFKIVLVLFASASVFGNKGNNNTYYGVDPSDIPLNRGYARVTYPASYNVPQQPEYTPASSYSPSYQKVNPGYSNTPNYNPQYSPSPSLYEEPSYSKTSSSSYNPGVYPAPLVYIPSGLHYSKSPYYAPTYSKLGSYGGANSNYGYSPYVQYNYPSYGTPPAEDYSSYQTSSYHTSDYSPAYNVKEEPKVAYPSPTVYKSPGPDYSLPYSGQAYPNLVYSPYPQSYSVPIVASKSEYSAEPPSEEYSSPYPDYNEQPEYYDNHPEPYQKPEGYAPRTYEYEYGSYSSNAKSAYSSKAPKSNMKSKSDKKPSSKLYSYKNKGYNNKYKTAEKSKKVTEEVTHTYEAITSRDSSDSSLCGVIPDTNFELYQTHPENTGYGVNDVAPYGKFPWTVVITYKKKFICTGVLIHSKYVLTSSYCIPEYKSLSNYRVRVGDWDLLTNYNEYEAYQNLDYKICGRYPIDHGGYDSSPYKTKDDGSDYNKDNNKDSGLVMLMIDDLINFDKRPQVKPICLPHFENYGQEAKVQGKGNVYEAASSSKSSSPYETKDSSKKSNSVCWVVGWYGSSKVPLKNHSPPTKLEESTKAYPHYHQKYYKGSDISRIQKRAKVRQIKCTSSDYTKGQSEGDVCFVGVEGNDACVADHGAAVFCVIPDEPIPYEKYNPGYNNNPNYFEGSYPEYSNENEYYYPHEQSEPQASYGKGNYNKEFKAFPSGPKPARYRAILYAIVQKTAKCRKQNLATYLSPDKSDVYSTKISKPIRATTVDGKSVKSIIQKFWESVEDQTCPGGQSQSVYKEPKVVRVSHKGKPEYNKNDYY